MIVFPNAKINIGLNIVEKRSDGFHNLETIFYPVNTCTDALEILSSDVDQLEIIGKDIPGNHQDNLIWKALNLLRKQYPKLNTPLQIILHKKIPMGAGLGGGSADAAFFVKAVTQMFELGITEQQLMDYTLQLGSDCPFFILNKPAFGFGRGEQLEEIKLNLDNYDIVLVCAPIHISTAAAFSGITPKKPEFDLRKLEAADIHNWKEYVHNDFEQNVFDLHPELASIKQQLYQEGALYASLTGTGAAVYGIFPKGVRPQLQRLPTGTEIFYA